MISCASSPAPARCSSRSSSSAGSWPAAPTSPGGSSPPRKTRRIYWLLVAKNACYLVGLVLVAAMVPDRLFGPVLFLSLFVPTLAFALITGRFEWEADDRRIDSPRRFWGLVTFYAVLIALFVVVLVWDWLSPTTA